uniref:NAD-dependent protein deacylase sirtuin-5A, mitochondrial n=1 Tax=Cacopsylla melanoneura TaxID=428564 RepID=A0A8D8SZE7_9HEMI
MWTWGINYILAVVYLTCSPGSADPTPSAIITPATSAHESNRLFKLHRLIRRGCRNIVIVTGPELSEIAGVSTYRSPNKEIAANFRACFHPLFKEDDQMGDVSPRFRFLNNIRTVAARAKPSRAHFALAAFEKVMRRRGKNLTIITENLDELHQRAGTKSIVECHGSMWKLRCSYCGHTKSDYHLPLTPALDPHGGPNLETVYNLPLIDEAELPRCNYHQRRFNHTCKELCAPYPFLTMLGLTHPEVIRDTEELIEDADMVIFIGTSDDEFKPLIPWGRECAYKGVPVVEIREKPWPNELTVGYRFHWHGDLNFWVPKVLNITQKQIEEEMALSEHGKFTSTPAPRTTDGIDWEYLFRNGSYLPDDVVAEYLANRTKPEHFFDDASWAKTYNISEEKIEDMDPRFKPGSYEGIL